MSELKLTEFQRDEVSAMLDVCQGEEERTEWGSLDYRTRVLTVTGPEDAVDDLLRRAAHLEDEGARVDEARVGAASARSLRGLAAKIGT